MSSLKQFKLPDVGEGLTEADIVKWHVRPGDEITINQIIVEIETAKAVVELPSPYAGVVDSLLVAEGTTADVGTPIIAVRVGDGEPEGAGASGGTDAAAAVSPEAEGQSLLVGYGVRPEAAARRTRRAGRGGRGEAAVDAAGAEAAGAEAAVGAAVGAAVAPEAIPAAAPPAAITPPAVPEPIGPPRAARALAKPPVRKLARDLGVDLSQLTGSGPAGSVTRADVEAAAAAARAPTAGAPTASSLEAAAAATADSGWDGLTAAVTGAGPAGGARAARLAALPREERIPIRGVRKHTAAAVSASAFTAPHVTEFLQIDITATMEATARLRALPEFEGIKVSPLLLVAKALLVAAARYPMINSSWDEAAQEIVVKHYVNLGIAAATGRGLLVPNIKDAHALALPELARELADLAETARAGRSTPADLAGGTISITNVGVLGVDSGTPIIVSGEAAILAFGQVKQAPWVHEGQLAVRQVCTLALSFDHRIVDGDLGSAVLRDVGAMLTDPLRMLAWS